MRGSALLDKMTLIDPAYVMDAEAAPTRKGRLWRKWAAAAACLGLVLAAAWLGLRAPAPGTPPAEESAGALPAENGVTIPKMEVNLSADLYGDMLGFFIYQGRCYLEYERLPDAADLVGEYRGTATGLVDEWTPAEGYVELAGSIYGDFYTVRGYDPEFMLCMKWGEDTVVTYVCGTGITVRTGAELYEDRFHLAEQYTGVSYETQASWFSPAPEQQTLQNAGDAVAAFLRGLNAGPCLLWDTVPPGAVEEQALYQDLRYHVYFTLRDGLTVHLWLYEGGYVRCQGMMDVCVQVSEEVYLPFLALLEQE